MVIQKAVHMLAGTNRFCENGRIPQSVGVILEDVCLVALIGILRVVVVICRAFGHGGNVAAVGSVTD